jgi:hypothetical protein
MGLSANAAVVVGVVLVASVSGVLVTDVDGDGLTVYSELRGTTAPFNADTDGDGLDDSLEQQLCTDPRDADTDGDGLSDGYERTTSQTAVCDPNTDDDGFSDGQEVWAQANGPHVYQNLDPLRKDIVVEVDALGQLPPQGAFDPVIAAFADAPLDNPDGSTGVSLHILRDEALAADTSTNDSESATLRYQNHDYRSYGAYHVVFVETIGYRPPESLGRAYHQSDGTPAGALVERHGPATMATFMHEMGHLIGLRVDSYRGIDSSLESFETYPSVMNYRAPLDVIAFADRDWTYLDTHTFTENTSYGHQPTELPTAL